MKQARTDTSQNETSNSFFTSNNLDFTKLPDTEN